MTETGPTDAAAPGGRELPWMNLAAVVSPLAVATALLFYFGRVRIAVEAAELGFDLSLVDLSPTDYIVRSVNIVFLPTMALTALLLVLIPVHERLVERSNRWSPRQRARPAAGLRLAGWLCAVAGLAALVLGPAPVRSVAIPFALTGLVVCRLYAAALARLTGAPPQPRTSRLIWWVLLVTLLFWDTERLARVAGVGYAQAIAEAPERLPAVGVHSTKDLGLSAPGVRMQHRTGPDLQYPFRYEGLRLLLRTNDHYLLINESWEPGTGRVFSLREADGLRLEFSREGGDPIGAG